MARKTFWTAATLAATLLAISPSVMARDGKVDVEHGLPSTTAVSVTENEGGTGVTIVRGPSYLMPAKPTTVEPVTLIDGQEIRINNLEPVGDWFIDRSDGRLVIIHCYTRQSTQVGGGRHILCNARQL